MSRFHRGGPAFQKPENALKRAEELVAVGQPASALQTLHVESCLWQNLLAEQSGLHLDQVISPPQSTLLVALQNHHYSHSTAIEATASNR